MFETKTLAPAKGQTTMMTMTMAMTMMTIITITCASGFAITVQANTAPLRLPPLLSMPTRGLSEVNIVNEDSSEYNLDFF